MWQTSGGLIAAVKEEDAVDVVRTLHEAGYTNARIIGGIKHRGEQDKAINLT